MSLLMALLFLIIGVSLIQRPQIVAGWIARLFKGGNAPAWLYGPAVLWFIRVMGLLALVNAAMYFYIARSTTALVH